MKIAIIVMLLFAAIAAALALPSAGKFRHTPNLTRHYDPQDDVPNRFRYMYIPDADGELHYVDLEQEVDVTSRVNPADVEFHLYTQRNLDRPYVLLLNEVGELGDFSVYDRRRRNVFVIHGWKSSGAGDVNAMLKEAILERYDANVFVVDWSVPAAAFYTTAKNYVPEVGAVVGNFIGDVITAYELSSADFALIGHSLGAHVAGCAGAQVARLNNGRKVDHIVGLDPAGPLFTYKNTDNRIDPSDADFVHVIHTNGGLLGFGSSIGHADYYPNGGRSQLGCGLDLAGSCSHSRSYQYLAESIRRPEFHSVLCNSFKNFEKGACKYNPRSVLGGFLLDKSAEGDYYLKTDTQEPFALGNV